MRLYGLLDEPLTFLDAYGQYDLMRKLKEFVVKNVDVTVIGVVHHMNIAAKYADSALPMKNARRLDFGDASMVLTRENIRAVFNIDVHDRFVISIRLVLLQSLLERK